MMNAHRKATGRGADGTTGRGMQRLQFELALDLSIPGGRPVEETLARAAESAGVDLLFALPAVNGRETIAVVRLNDEGSDSFLAVKAADGAFTYCDEAEMDKAVLRLAQASVDVLRRLLADHDIRKKLAAA